MTTTETSGGTARIPGRADIPFSELLGVWTKIGFLSFGGPAGQIAMMHRILVDEKKWIDEKRYLNALNFAMLLPGPEAQQLATYTGWLTHGIRGGLAAGILFVLPGALVMLALSFIYVAFREAPLVDAVFFGIKAAVLAIVFQALIRIAQRALGTALKLSFAAMAFAAIFIFQVPFPIVVIAAGVAGLLLLADPEDEAPSANAADGGGNLVARSIRMIAIFGTLWFTPIALAALAFGPNHVLVEVGLFFSQLAVVTFGGAYAVLAYMAQAAVDTYGWMAPGEMIDGLGLAETTPGPLIMVTQFVGFLAGFRAPEPFTPYTMAILAAVMTTWVTFVPCFLWIFLGAPFIERMKSNRRVSAALSGITAAVVGVIANLSLWFGLHVVFREVGRLEAGPIDMAWPVWASIDWLSLGLVLAAFAAVFLARAGLLVTLAGAALAGIVLHFLLGA